MTKALSPSLKADVYRLVDILKAKSGLGASYEIEKLCRAVKANSAVVDNRVWKLLKNAFNPETPLTQDERQFIAALSRDLAAWHTAPVQPRVRGPWTSILHIRVGDVETDVLNAVKKRTGETHAEIVRRLIRAAK